MKHFLIIDGNSLGHYAQNGAKKLTIGTMEVQAIFGFLRTLKSYVFKYHFATPVVLWDGMSWRNQIYPEYKSNREKATTAAEIKQQEVRKSYTKQRPHIQKALSMLGVTQVNAQNMEADDLAAIMVKNYVAQGHKVTLVSEDQDWLQLIQKNVTMERIMAKDRVTPLNLSAITGVATTKQFIEKKALSGDSGDFIKGVGGVGPKRAIEFLETYGSFNNFLNMVTLEKSVDLKTLPKYFRNLIEDESRAIAFDFNLRLVDLNTTARPAPVGFQVNKGEPSVENFRKFCDLLLFKSITDSFDHWIECFPLGQTVVAQ